jgi:hypothetical protein
MMFAGVQLHPGRTLSEKKAVLERRGIASHMIGDNKSGALLLTDPNGITLFCFEGLPGPVFAAWGASLMREIRALARP